MLDLAADMRLCFLLSLSSSPEARRPRLLRVRELALVPGPGSLATDTRLERREAEGAGR